jgi:preprotein translocase subunit SecB
MDKTVESTFHFEDYKIDYIDFKLNKNFQADSYPDIEYKLLVNVEVSKETHKAQVNLKLKINKQSENKNLPFESEVSITGLFSSSDDVEEETMMSFCKLNATSALFPYLRSAITDITKIANIPSIVLPLVNVYNLIRESESNIEK